MGPSVGDLRTIALFMRSSDAELTELAQLFEVMERSPHDVVLFDIGQPADAMYLLTEGTALLESPEDDVHHLHPPALLGELGALTGVPRSTKVTVRDAVCYRVDALKWQQFLFEHHGVGLRVLRDVLRAAAEKIHRDQVRIGTMRQISLWTQSELKDVVAQLAALPETPATRSAAAAVDSLILRNRRGAMRVEPTASMPASLMVDRKAEPPPPAPPPAPAPPAPAPAVRSTLLPIPPRERASTEGQGGQGGQGGHGGHGSHGSSDGGGPPVSVSGLTALGTRLPAQLLELSRTHLSFSCDGAEWSAGDALSGLLVLAGRALPISGKVLRSHEGRVTLALDELAGEHAAPLDGYLTRAQLLDILL